MAWIPLFFMATGMMSLIMNMHVLGGVLLVLCFISLGGDANRTE